MPEPASTRLSTARVLSHLVVMVVVSAVLGLVVAGLALPFAGVLGIGTEKVAKSMTGLPAELKTEPLPQRTLVLDAGGNLIATFYDQNRVNVSLSQISRKMVKATVGIEDYRFYEHGALDLKGTLRALITNQVNSGVVQGGSSITQQMVKLTLVTQAKGNKKKVLEATDQTYSRKLAELRYAIAIEQHYPKDWILERYLNLAYYGDGAYGVQSAARHYFNTNAKDLTWAQAAMLAGLVKNPNGYEPTDAPDRALDRRNVVLDRLGQLGVLKPNKVAQLKKQGLGLDVTETNNGCVSSRAPFFCDYVRNWLLKDKSLGKTVAERDELLETGGLTINTTIDLRAQDAADASVAEHVYPTDQAIGALAMVEPRTGAVKAIAQSRPMGAAVKQGQTYLNYIVPEKYGDANGFQAGSTFKAFVLASAIDQKIPLNTQIPSPPTIDIPMSEFPTCGGHNYYSSDVWSPSNSTTSGTKDLYSGTQESVNTFYAQLEKMTGLCQPYKLAKQMGIELTDPDRERVPSFTLGVVNTSPLEMAEAYATFAGRGLHCDSRPVTSIQDSDGNVVKEYKPQCDQVLPAPVADAVNDVLKGVQEPGGFGYNAGLALTQQSAGKTGTINDNKAVWFVGYTPALATASMIAGANSEGSWITLNGQTVGGSYISSAAGSTTAGPMWGDAMQVIQAWLPDDTFVPPTAQDIAGVVTGIPVTGGMSIETARATLESAGFLVEVSTTAVNSTYPAGLVAYTVPGGGTSAASGTTLTIYPSNGIPPPPPRKPRKPRKPHKPGGR